MKLTIITALLLTIIGCSTGPSKLQRIETLEGASASQQTQINQNKDAIEVNSAAIIDTNIKIDRMFEKALYK
jgi:hypothetical protein